MPAIKVKGMSCQHCVASVTKALRAIDGITEVNIDLSSGTVDYQEEKPVSIDIVKQAIFKTGFEVV